MSATAGNVCTTSPRELGLMMRIDFKIRGLQSLDATLQNLQSKIFTLKFLLASESESLGQERRQAGLDNFLLRGFEIVFYAPLLDHVFFHVVNAISGAPVAVARLPHAARVDEILFRGSIGS